MSNPSDPGGWGEPQEPPPSAPPPSGAPSWGPPGTPPGYGQGQPSAYGGPAGYPPAPPGTGTYFDQASGLVLPAGTQLASVGRRIGAWFLAIPLAVITLGIGYLVWGLIVWGRGQTPALQVLGMRCYRPETGKVAGWGSMALREIIGRLVDGILSIITYLVSFILFLSRSDRRSLHDLVAGTVVLHDPDKVLAGR